MPEKKMVEVGYGVTHSLQEIADLMGITRERVRQIEKSAMAKIRRELKSRYGVTNLAEFLG